MGRGWCFWGELFCFYIKKIKKNFVVENKIRFLFCKNVIAVKNEICIFFLGTEDKFLILFWGDDLKY